MTINPITATVPIRGMASDAFNTASDAYLPQMKQFSAELAADFPTIAAAAGYASQAQSAAAASVSATGYMATASDSQSLTATSKTFAIAAGKSFVAADKIHICRRSDPTARMRGSVTSYSGTALVVNITEAPVTGGPFTDWMIVHAAFVPDLTAGRHALWIPASSLIPRTTSGAASGVTETTTNKVMRRTLDFDASAQEFAQCMIRMPKSWNEGTISFVAVWLHPATTTNFGVGWAMQAVALSDTDASDAAWGTAQQVNDVGGTTGAIYISPESAAITIAGSPLPEDLVALQFYRNATDATNDTLAVDAQLLGFTAYITTNAETDA